MEPEQLYQTMFKLEELVNGCGPDCMGVISISADDIEPIVDKLSSDDVQVLSDRAFYVPVPLLRDIVESWVKSGRPKPEEGDLNAVRKLRRGKGGQSKTLESALKANEVGHAMTGPTPAPMPETPKAKRQQD